MTVRYPAGPVTPHGWYHLVKGQIPMMWLTAYDESIITHLTGGLSIPDRYEAPECVHLTGLKGLIAPWKHITQKGATQDGVTHIDALYDPTEVEAQLECWGRDAKHTRKVYRDLIGSIDAKQQSLLHFFTQEEGHWWAPIRWFQGAPPEPVSFDRHQRVSLRLQADDAFWRTYDHADNFTFTYEDMTATSFDEGLSGWPQYRYEGTGGGGPVGTGTQIKWDESGNDGVSVMLGPFEDFDTDTNDQVVNIVIGSPSEYGLFDGAFVDLWARCNRDGSGDWAGDGVRARIGMGRVFITAFVNFVEVWERQWLKPIPPVWGEKYSLVAGTPGDPRRFRILRNGLPLLTHKESGTASMLGEDHRGIGVGMRAGAALLSQASPSTIRKVSAGDNAEVSQSGFLKRINIGDQPMYDDYTLFGPGMFKLYDGPGSDEYVEFGPLLPNQVVFLRTDPRTNTTLVQDMTVTPAWPQQLNVFQDALQKFLTFAGANGSALEDQVKSMFGVQPPQGNLYKYLSGRFSDNAAIPAKSPGNPVAPYFVKVEIEGGNADSMVIASGTPRRRYPL